LTNRQSVLRDSISYPTINAPPYYDCNVSELSFDKNEQNIDSEWTSDLRHDNLQYHFENIGTDDDLSHNDLEFGTNEFVDNKPTDLYFHVGHMDNFHDTLLHFPGNENEDNVLENQSILNDIISVVESPRLLVAPSLTSYANIYRVMNQLHVPFYGYDLILNTIRKEMFERNLDLREQEYSRKSFLKEIQQRFQCPKPNIVPVHLENRWNDRENAGLINPRDTVEVITFDFSEQRIDILNNELLFGNIDNHVVNRCINNPMSKWLPYERKDPNFVYEFLDGNWYQQYAKTLVVNPS
jgi:hypothetical protein